MFTKFWSDINHDLRHEKKGLWKTQYYLCILNINYASFNISGRILMFGLIVYAVFVATGLTVTSILLSYFAIQALKARKPRHQEDSGLTDLTSQTFGEIVT